MASQPEIEAMRVMLAEMASDSNVFAGMLLSVADMEYQGFNPLLLLAELEKRANKANVEQEVHKKNLLTLAVMGTMRGSNLTKLKGKSTIQQKTYLDKMIKTYTLISGTPKTNVDATLVRIAACFAQIISAGMSSGALKIRPTISPSSLAPGFPLAMCLSTFGSLIPAPDNYFDAADAAILFNAFCYHQYKFDEVINSSKKVKSTPEAINRFADIQYRSDLYSEDVRRSHCLKVGILIINSSRVLTISGTCRPALAEADRLWRNTYQM